MKSAAGFTRVELTILIVLMVLMGVLSVPFFKVLQLNRMKAQGVRNCEQIIVALKHFAKDRQSQYPDTVRDSKSGQTSSCSNDAFRLLIQERIITDERIFGCPNGYNPDGNLGSPPELKMALMSGENHWAMTVGQTDSSPGGMPLVFENSASVSWPPQWNADCNDMRPGRTWPDGQIIIGRNDGSVKIEKLSGEKGMVSIMRGSDGMDSFMKASSGIPQRVLPIALNSFACPGQSRWSEFLASPFPQTSIPPTPLPVPLK